MGISFKKVFKGAKKVAKAGWKATGHALDPAGLVTGDSLFGGGGGDDRMGQIEGLYGQAAYTLGQNSARAQTERRRALRDTKAGYTGARGALAKGRAAGAVAIQDQGAQNMAQVEQSTAARGLYNTTILDNARSGTGANTARNLADLEARYALMLGELGVDEARAIGAIRGDIAGGFERFGANMASLHTGHAGLLASIPEESDDEWLESLMQIGGNLVGYGIGGGFGGGGGGSGGGGQLQTPVFHGSAG